MTHEEFVTSRQNEEIPPSVEESEEDCLPIAPAVTFPAGPLTRAVCEMSKEKKKHLRAKTKSVLGDWEL